MLSIIQLRLQRLKGEYYVFIIMTLMSLMFTFVFGAAQRQDYTPTVLVIDYDNSSYSQKVFDELINDNTFRYELSNYEEAVKRVEEGKVLAALVINEGFANSIENNLEPSLGVIKTRNDVDIRIFENIVSGISRKMISNVRIAELTTSYMKDSKDINEDNVFEVAYNKATNHWRYKKPIAIKSGILDENNSTGYDNLTHSIIGFSLFFSMYTIVFAIGEILNERKYRTWQRILVSPISKTSVLGGNLVVSYLVGFAQVSILFVAGKYLFGFDLGDNLLGVMMVLAAFVFTITSLGLFLSGIVKTHSQLAAVTPIVLTSTAMLGGCMWPLEIVNNKIALALANITPQKWAIEGIEAIAMYGKGFSGALTPTLVLLGMGLVFFGIGVKLVKFE